MILLYVGYTDEYIYICGSLHTYVHDRTHIKIGTSHAFRTQNLILKPT